MVEAILGLLGTCVTALFGWVFTTNTKVNVTDQRVDDLKEKMEADKTQLKELMEVQFDSMGQRLDRIERALNGALRGH